MTRDERLTETETIIRWDGHKDKVRIFTASKAVDGKIRRAGHAPYRQNTRKGAWSGSFYEVPYKAIRWGVRMPLPPKNRPFSRGFRPKTGMLGDTGHAQ